MPKKTTNRVSASSKTGRTLSKPRTGTALVPVEAHARAIVPLTDTEAAEPVIQREGGVTLVIGQL